VFRARGAMVGHINRKGLLMFPALTTPRDLRRLYNAVAPTWHGKIAALGYADAYRAAIAAFIPDCRRPIRVMDVGCGAGSFARAFVQERGRIEVLTLVDPAVDMLHEAEACLDGDAGEVVLLNRSIDALPNFPSQDVILCAHVLDHCTDPVRAIRALGATLAPRGAIVLIVTKPHWCNWLIWPAWRHKSYRVSQIHEAVVAAGLTCPRDMGFERGPPRRTSHAYLITHKEPEIRYADCHR
jgi:ubiquinone/menaquinone biosynthesis C-methylase UbiE